MTRTSTGACAAPRPERAADTRAAASPFLTPLPPPHPHRCPPACSHVILPKELAKSLQPKRLLAEAEWRALGVQQSRGWANYAIHRPEPHILLFRRELGTDPMTGKVRAQRKLARGLMCSTHTYTCSRPLHALHPFALSPTAAGEPPAQAAGPGELRQGVQVEGSVRPAPPASIVIREGWGCRAGGAALRAQRAPARECIPAGFPLCRYTACSCSARSAPPPTRSAPHWLAG